MMDATTQFFHAAIARLYGEKMGMEDQAFMLKQELGKCNEELSRAAQQSLAAAEEITKLRAAMVEMQENLNANVEARIAEEKNRARLEEIIEKLYKENDRLNTELAREQDRQQSNRLAEGMMRAAGHDLIQSAVSQADLDQADHTRQRAGRVTMILGGTSIPDPAGDLRDIHGNLVDEQGRRFPMMLSGREMTREERNKWLADGGFDGPISSISDPMAGASA
jgi:hypothetical protein